MLEGLHYQVIRADIVKLADVRVIQRCDRASFALEAFTELGCGSLDGDNAVQTRIARLPHLPHAARADWRKDFVGAEFVAGRDRHMQGSV